jgi:hypothetical protein
MNRNYDFQSAIAPLSMLNGTILLAMPSASLLTTYARLKFALN